MKNTRALKFLFSILVLLSLFSDGASAGEICAFEGTVDVVRGGFRLGVMTDGQGSLSVTGEKVSDGEYRFTLDIDHLKTPFFDVLSKMESAVQFGGGQGIRGQGPVLMGKIWSQYSLIDYKPIKEVSGRFQVKDKKLDLMALSIGDVTCQGSMGLVAPYPIDLRFDFFNVEMGDFLDFWDRGRLYAAGGLVLGRIKVSGTAAHPVLEGILESRDGFVHNLNYHSIVLNVEGVYPRLNITQSTVLQTDGVSYTMDGPIDLSDKDGFKRQIQALTFSPLVSGSDSEREWTIKRFKSEPLGTTELKYRFQKSGVLGVDPRGEDEIDMFGLERTQKF